MGRRIAVALLVALGLFAGGGAGAQTTTSSSSTTSSSTTSTSTTSTTLVSTTTSSTTSTTRVHPCAGQTCTTDPPGAVLSTASKEITTDRGSYCWRDPIGDSTRCIALALAPGYKPPILVVTQGEVVTVRFTAPVAISPLEVALLRSGERTALTSANPTSFRVDLAPGIYEEVGLLTRWIQGEVPYAFRLDVRASAPPATPGVPGPLALTG